MLINLICKMKNLTYLANYSSKLEVVHCFARHRWPSSMLCDRTNHMQNYHKQMGARESMHYCLWVIKVLTIIFPHWLRTCSAIDKNGPRKYHLTIYDILIFTNPEETQARINNCSNKILWDAITYPWLRYLLQTPNSSSMNNGSTSIFNRPTMNYRLIHHQRHVTGNNRGNLSKIRSQIEFFGPLPMITTTFVDESFWNFSQNAPVNCRALCKISKRFVDYEWRYGPMRFFMRFQVKVDVGHIF